MAILFSISCSCIGRSLKPGATEITWQAKLGLKIAVGGSLFILLSSYLIRHYIEIGVFSDFIFRLFG